MPSADINNPMALLRRSATPLGGLKRSEAARRKPQIPKQSQISTEGCIVSGGNHLMGGIMLFFGEISASDQFLGGLMATQRPDNV